MKKVIIFIIVIALVFIIIPAMIYAGNGPKNKATGEIWMDNPDQHLKFNAHDVAGPYEDKGQVEYWNYEYVGGLLHYTASVISVKVVGDTARFLYQIPEGWPRLSGLYVVMEVKDVGSPGTNGDEFGLKATSDLELAIEWCEDGIIVNYYPVNYYPITAGNLVVHYSE